MRHLLYHPESESYVEVTTEDELLKLMGSSEGGLLCEVTDMEEHEDKFRSQEVK